MPPVSWDTPLGFILWMLWRATAITYLTHAVCALLRLRGRCLSHWLGKLLAQADPVNFRGQSADLADAVLRHPMIGSPSLCGDAISREQLLLVMLELADADAQFSPSLQAALDDPAVLGRLNLWFDQAMTRATRSYRFQTGIFTALASLTVLALTSDAPFTNLRAFGGQWIPLTLGTPFWYDLLKRFVPLLRGAGVGRVHRRPR